MRIVVIAEDGTGYRFATGAVDRRVAEELAGQGDEEPAARLARLRTWRGIDAGEAFTSWRSLSKRDLPKGFRVTGFAGKKRGFDFDAVRKALLLCHLAGERRPEAVLLVRDLDHRHAEERAASIREAVESFGGKFAVVAALARPEAEAWFLNGFEPANRHETKRRAEAERRLGFCPVSAAHRLTSTRKNDARDAKVVFAELMPDVDRQDDCFERTAWQVLRANGRHTGLAAFLDEVEARLVPLVVGERGE